MVVVSKPWIKFVAELDGSMAVIVRYCAVDRLPRGLFIRQVNLAAGDTMANHSEHWDAVFSIGDDRQLGWYEHDVSQTLKFFKHLKLNADSQIFLAGAGTSSLVDELLKTGSHLILNDISALALAKLKSRVGDGNYQMLQHDLGMPLTQVQLVDLWVDRAVLHFLLDESAITQYFDNLKASVKSDGYVLLAEFSKAGVEECAGLPVHRYSLEEMQARLGKGFRLIESEDYVFISPHGQKRLYVYALFQRW